MLNETHILTSIGLYYKKHRRRVKENLEQKRVELRDNNVFSVKKDHFPLYCYY